MNRNQSKKRMGINKGEILSEEKLISAAESGNTALVKRLIKKGVDIHFVENDELGYNALHYASFNGHTEVVQDLILAGADVNRLTTDNYSPLMLAALTGFTEVASTILKNSNPDMSIRTQDDSQPHNDMTCLHLAVLSGNKELVQLLIAHGAEREALANGYSVLHIAAEMGYTDIIQTILQEIPSLRAPAHHHFRWTADDRTAIQLAVASGVHEAVAVLLADGEIDANYPDQDGYTPLHLAVSFQLRDTVNVLLKNGVAVNTQLLNGRTPLLDAVLSSDYKITEMLLKYGADVTLYDSSKLTPLIAAAAEGNERIVRSLLSSFSTSTPTGISRVGSQEKEVNGDALARAEYLAFLCNQQDEMGNTALHYAVEGGPEGVIKRLLRAGADITLPNQSGRSAWDLAEEFGTLKLRQLLLSTHAQVSAPASPVVSPLPSSSVASDNQKQQMSNELSGDTARSSAIPVPMFPDIRGDNVPPATEVSPAQCPQGQSHRHQGEDVIDLDCPPSVPAAVLTPNPTTTTAAISTSADPNEQTPSATSAVGEDEDDGCRCDGQADDTGLPTPNTAAAMEVCEYVLTDRGELMQDCFLQEVEVGVEEGLHDGSEDSWESVHFHLDTDAGSGAGVDANGGTLSDPLPAAGMQFLDISDDLSGVYASIAAFRECGLSTAKCRGDGGDDDLQDWTFHMGSSESPSNQQNQQQPQPGQPNSQHSSSDGRNTPDPSFSFSSAGSASSTGSGSGSDHSRHSRGGKRGQRKGGGKGLGQRRRIQQQQQQHQDQHQYQGQQQCKGLGLDGTVAEENVPKWERKREVRQQKREQIRQERRRHRQAERKRADSAASATSTAEAETGTAGARAEARTKAGAGASAGEPLASGEGFWNSESLPSSQDYDDRSLDAYFESECRTPCACAFGDDDARLYTQHKIAATERQIDHLQKRIYRLQMRELLERQKLQEHEEHDWDEEIHFSVPQCTGGPHRRSRSLSRSHSRSRAQSPRGTDAGAPCDTLAQFPHRRPESSRRSEFGSHNTGCSVGAGVGRGSGSSRLDVRQGQDQGFTVDQPPLPGATLSQFDRTFLEALSIILLLVAFALLLFIRLRLLRS